MTAKLQTRTSVSALMGTQVVDAGGRRLGSVREFAVTPLTDSCCVQALAIRPSGSGRRAPLSLVRTGALVWNTAGTLMLADQDQLVSMSKSDDYLMLERDLLDQQIIDVHGHKVVRVNDVDLIWEESGGVLSLRIAEVEVGLRGALRRLLKGLPQTQIDRLATRLRPSVIPWEFVDLIDRDPARRVRLKIEQDRLAKMHPSDLADILEELAPAERQALFSSLDEQVAAEALEEVELKTQKTLIENLDSERVAGIIEEMDPGAAADLLSELSNERSDAILEEMGERERQDVEELLEYEPDSAAGLMTTEYIALPEDATTEDAAVAFASWKGDLETITEIFLLDPGEHLTGQVALARLMTPAVNDSLRSQSVDHVVSCSANANARKVAELFDKYNLRSLPVLDEGGRLAGVIRAEHVIGWLRTR